MATTTNYGWTTPDDTALVKDGASAIRALGTAIDTSMNTALGTKKSGLVLLNTTSFSGVASQAVSSIMSSTYLNYRITLNITSVTADNSIYMKLRSSTTDSSASYTNNRIQITTGTVSGAYGPAETTGFFLLNPDTGVGSGYYGVGIDLYNPNVALTTTAQIFSVGLNNAGSYFAFTGGCYHEISTAYDGINIIASSGNMTGSVNIYGYNK